MVTGRLTRTCVAAQKAEKEKLGEAFDGEINGWDLMYYHTILLDTEFRLDEDKIKEYFPLEKVTTGMFDIYQRILGLKFEQVRAHTGEGGGGAIH